jgi:hypothetical protein
MNIDIILDQILAMELGEIDTFKLSDNRFLFVDNWGWEDDEDKFTSLELNSGYEENGDYVLEQVLECGTYDFQNKEEIRSGIEYMINCI